jgi:hypothetical protein
MHPLRRRLLLEYARGPVNPSAVAARLDRPLNLVCYHTGVLARGGLLELVRCERAHGRLTRFYAATVEPFIEEPSWLELPVAVRRRLVASALNEIRDAARGAARSGGFDAREAELFRVPLDLDEQGLTEVARLLRGAEQELLRIATASRARSGGAAAPYGVVTLGFKPT